uniref:PHD-type domain-containing protein n=1 Tax=Salix viminalis TaxID=40686 RepID=A0A6N2NCI5_SALVM
MLLHDLIPGSVESSLPFAPNYSRQDLFSEWVPQKAWKSPLVQVEFPQDGSNPLIAGNCYDIPGSYVARKRRKKSAIMSSIEPETDKAPTNAVNCDLPVIHDDCVRARTVPSIVAQSNSGMGVGSITARINISNIVEHPDSKLEVSGDDLSIREFCTSVLRSHGLLAGDCPVSNSAPTEVLRNIKNDNFFQSCELCGNFEKALNILLCDHCEDAFHLSCCNLNMEMLPADLWFCPSCSKLNNNVSQETSFLKKCSVSWWNGRSKLGPIASMLKYPEAHTSRVRIGTSYQATVPEWSDQLSMDSDCFGEPIEIDTSQNVCLHECPQDRPSNAMPMSNWLQCQEVLHDDAGGVEGTICGKWRRAPFSEVQTDSWDCSCSVLWDPSHSDCAVPQELETDEVSRQLKYVEQLRLRLAKKRRIS